MEKRIKKVRDYFKNGSQFDIILRRELEKSCDAHILESNEFYADFRKEIGVSSETEGAIQIVKRICDDKVFHKGDMIESKQFGTCFIIEFSEDLIHCSVANVFEQNTTSVEINYLGLSHEV